MLETISILIEMTLDLAHSYFYFYLGVVTGVIISDWY